MNWFFIAGMPRSGTTLLRLCLDSHIDITCYDERTSYERLGGETGGDAELSDSPLTGFKVPFRSMVLHRAWVVWNERKGSEGKCIFMLRDPRATISSLRRLMGGHYWKNERVRKEWELRLSHPLLHGEFLNELEAVESESETDRPFALAAAAWKAHYAMFERLRNEGKPVLGVAYDDLVTDPEKTLRKVLEFLGVGWDASVLSPEKYAHLEVENGAAPGLNEVRTIDVNSLRRWEKDLTPRRVALIEKYTLDRLDVLRADTNLAGREETFSGGSN